MSLTWQKWGCWCAVLGSLSMTGPAWAVDGWLGWRGPHQNGVADETGLIDSVELGGEYHLWTVDLKGGGTPVIADERVFIFGYRGEGSDLREVLACLDAATGDLLWERVFPDFLSDIIYDRYGIGSPTIDPATGNVYLQTTNGVLAGFTGDGEPLWEVSMMESYGRLTFPNGRTGAVVIDDDLVITHAITANWGRQGPARDRFYAFDKLTGAPVWASTPGIGPKDSSFSTPVLEWRNGRRVMYAGTGCGNVVAIDVRTGDPLWRAPMAVGGVNVSVVVEGDTLVAVHAKENLDASNMGRMVAWDLSAAPEPSPEGGTPILRTERWRNDDLVAFTSSPVLAGGTVYEVVATGELVAVELASGTTRWSLKLGADQLHASPLYADGKLYVPMRDGMFHIVEPGDSEGRVLSSVQLKGAALGAPAVWKGRILVQTTEALYAFGVPTASGPAWPVEKRPEPTEVMRIQVVPAEVLLRSGEAASPVARRLDAAGTLVDTVPLDDLVSWIPPTAKVQSTLDVEWAEGQLTAPDPVGYSAGAFQGTAGAQVGTLRGRTVPGVPFEEDFEAFELTDGFAYPPLAWIGARFKWQIREHEGSKLLAKTLDRMLFQRSTTFIGHPDEAGYTVTADVMTDGDRRNRGDIGIVVQRYFVVLKGNQRQLEVSSNYERLRQGTPFEVEPGVWYRLRARVDVDEDGVATIRVKAWPRDDEEPEGWTLEVIHRDGHTHGSPGLFGFSPQNLHRVYIDNVVVTRSEEAQ